MNDMSPVRSAPIVRELAADAQIVSKIPRATPWPDISAHRTLAASYPYFWEDGAMAALIARYEAPDEKKPGQIKKWICPYTFWRNADGTHVWARKGMEGLQPLYNLPDLIERQNAMVILSEGEKCADAVKVAFPGCVSITWAGGTNALKKSDFSFLKGRNVVISPDHDDPGRAAATALIAILTEVGAKRIRTLDIAALGALVSAEVPQGYDIADAVRDGLAEGRLKALIAAHPTLITEAKSGASELSKEAGSNAEGSQDDRVEGKECVPLAALDIEEDAFLAHLKKEWGWAPNFPEGYDLTSEGLYKQSISARGEPVAIFVGSPIAVVGQSRPAEGGPGWGRIVAFPRPDGVIVTVILPSDLGVGDGREIRKILAEHGFRCPNDRTGRLALADYISHSVARDIVEITSRPGWVGDSFALPQGVISPPGETRRIKLDMGAKAHLFALAGEAEDWRRLAELVGQSSRAAFALSIAFSAVLLKPMNESGGGFHFYGQSSRSKTTLLVLAGSVFGGGGIDGFVQTWLRTGNSAEAAAADHNDCLIALDELGLSDPELAADLYYMLANGHGKGRATVLGTARPSVQWRAMALSSGEDSSVVHMRSGMRGAKKRLTGGVAVRMVDIPIEVAPGRSFENIGNFGSEGLLAEHIGREARRVYGHAGPEFIRRLVADRETHLATARRIKDSFVATVTGPQDDPQVRRIAGRFGLVAAAGSLATQFGLLPWKKEAAFEATVTCYQAWKDARGTARSEEERDALRALRVFFELHGRSRFEAITPATLLAPEQDVRREEDRPVRDRCGYRTTDEGGHAVIYVTPEAFRSEVCDGHSPDIMLRVARDCGALLLGEGAHLQKNVRLPDHPGTTRVYAFLPHRLD